MLGNKTKTGDLSASKDQNKLSKLIEVEEAKMVSKT